MSTSFRSLIDLFKSVSVSTCSLSLMVSLKVCLVDYSQKLQNGGVSKGGLNHTEDRRLEVIRARFSFSGL